MKRFPKISFKKAISTFVNFHKQFTISKYLCNYTYVSFLLSIQLHYFGWSFILYYVLELLFMVGNTEDHLWTCHIPE